MRKGVLVIFLVSLVCNTNGGIPLDSNKVLMDSLKRENIELQNKVLFLELRKKIMDSVTMNGSPVLIEKVNAIDKTNTAFQFVFSGFITLVLFILGVLGWAIWNNSDKVARVTAKDEFQKAFKDYEAEIKGMSAQIKEMYEEIDTYHKTVVGYKTQTQVLNIEKIKERNKNAATS
jgi:hypothetical protein